MWWHTWEMWGRGRFRKIRKNKRRIRTRSISFLSDNYIYIMAEPLELNPILQHVRLLRKRYKELRQPQTPSPTDSEKARELGIDEGSDCEVSVSRPYRHDRYGMLGGPKTFTRLTPVLERSNENSPSRSSAASAVTWSECGYSISYRRKSSLPLEAFLDPPETESKEEGEPTDGSPSRPPSRALVRSPGLSFNKGDDKEPSKFVDLEAGPDPDPSSEPSTSTSSYPSPLPSNIPSTESSRLPSADSSTVPSPEHSPCKMARRDPDVEAGHPIKTIKPVLPPFKRPTTLPGDPRAVSSSSSSSSSSSASSESPSMSMSTSSISLSSPSSLTAPPTTRMTELKLKSKQEPEPEDSDSSLSDSRPPNRLPARPHRLDTSDGSRPPHPRDYETSSDDDPSSPYPVDCSLLEDLRDFNMNNDPFRICSIDNFIKDEQYLNDLVDFVKNGEFEKRESDMFTYSQMKDEKFMKNLLTERLMTTLVQKMIPFLYKLTHIKLDPGKVSLNCSKYQYTDHLLCHDDMSGDRKVAFILYLNKNWERIWGGTLDFYRRDHVNDPGPITGSLVPEFNKLIFFEVTAFSFHQVAEVVKEGAERYTINGWFHSKKPVTQRSLFEPGLCSIRPRDIDVPEEIFDSRMNPRWLKEKYIEPKRENYKRTGAEQVVGFLERNFYNKFIEELQGVTEWIEVGPPNRRCYEILPRSSLNDWLKNACRTFLSEWMFKTVWRYTSAKIHPEAFREELQRPDAPPHASVTFIGQLPVEASSSAKKDVTTTTPLTADPRISFSIRRWRKGFYATALDDNDEMIGTRGRVVHALITGGHTEATPASEGGLYCYVNRMNGEKRHDFHACGRNNTINFVELRRDEYRFVKYLNNKSNGVYYDINMVFKE